MPAGEVRPARPSDAADLGLAHVRAWQAAYQGLMPQGFLDRMDVAGRQSAWERLLSTGRTAGQEVLVADDAGRVVGFVYVGPTRDDDADTGVGEVLAINLHPDSWGKGWGRRLMAGGLTALSAAGFSEATLWVLDGNARARRFYEAGGWCPDGTTKRDEHLGFGIDELRYRRRL